VFSLLFLGLLLGLVAFSLLVEQPAVRGTAADPAVIQGKINASNAAVKAQLESQRKLQLEVAAYLALFALSLIFLPIIFITLIPPLTPLGIVLTFIYIGITFKTYNDIIRS
jgi:hypothetical protein